MHVKPGATSALVSAHLVLSSLHAPHDCCCRLTEAVPACSDLRGVLLLRVCLLHQEPCLCQGARCRCRPPCRSTLTVRGRPSSLSHLRQRQRPSCYVPHHITCYLLHSFACAAEPGWLRGRSTLMTGPAPLLTGFAAGASGTGKAVQLGQGKRAFRQGSGIDVYAGATFPPISPGMVGLCVRCNRPPFSSSVSGQSATLATLVHSLCFTGQYAHVAWL